MNAEQLEKITFINGELNAALRHMEIDVRRVRACQSGEETVVTVERGNGKTFNFDASNLTLKQTAIYILKRV